jgi:hypothetical protein
MTTPGHLPTFSSEVKYSTIFMGLPPSTKYLRHTLSTLDTLLEEMRRTLQEDDDTFIPVVRRAEKDFADAAWASKEMADAALAWKKGLVFDLGLYEHQYEKQ